MNSLHSHGIDPRIGLQILCVPLLLSLSPWASAQAAPLRAGPSPAVILRSPSTAAHPWARLHPASAVPTAGPIFRQDGGTAMTFAEPFGAVLEDARPVCVLSPDAAPRSAPEASLSMFAKSVIESTGAIEADVLAFRALLGDPLNGATPGQQPAGRREINWDGVPAAVTNVLTFPNDFFNTNSPRGLIYNRASRGLEVSDNRFTNINPTYAAEFNPFSGQKLFSPIGRNVSDVRFLVAGSDIEATVRGFGVVFLDVDTEGVSGIELFAQDGHSLGEFAAPVRSDARGASFIGVVYRNPLISRVRIITGDGRLAPDEIDVSQGGRHDLVVLDDLLYGEPMATGD